MGAETAHAGIDLEVDGCSLRGREGIESGFLGGRDGGDESASGNFGVFLRQGCAEEQDRDPLQDPPQLKCLPKRGDGKDLHSPVKDTNDLLEAVSVGIGLHDRHDAGLAGQFLHGSQVMP